MLIPIQRYPLDKTGNNPDNLVVGELHTLSDQQIRAIAPTYGAFYADESLKVYDHSTGRLLVRGTHYQCAELLQDASMMTGKEVCLVILITDSVVSNRVRLNLQMLGGEFQNSAAGIISLYESTMKDNRPVPWVNVLNKPTEYNPTIHRHLLEDVFGFEAVVAAIERVRNAIILSDVPAFEYLIDYLKGQLDSLRTDLSGTEARVLAALRLELAPLLSHLTDYANPHHVTMAQLGFDRYELLPHARHTNSGYSLDFGVKSYGSSDGTLLYWHIEFTAPTNNYFTAADGVCSVQGDKSGFSTQVRAGLVVDKNAVFVATLRRGRVDGPVVATSQAMCLMDLLVPEVTADMWMHNLLDPGVKRNPVTYYVIGSRNHGTATVRRIINPKKPIADITGDVVNAAMLTTCCVFNPRIRVTPTSMFVVGSNEMD